MKMVASVRPLSKQEVVTLLDSIPVFNIVNEENRIVGTTDTAGEEAVRWFVDADEAVYSGGSELTLKSNGHAVPLWQAAQRFKGL